MHLLHCTFYSGLNLSLFPTSLFPDSIEMCALLVLFALNDLG